MPETVKSSPATEHNTWIEVRLDRILENLKAIHQYQNPHADVLAVIKANAYGHGLVPVARVLAPQVRYLGVSSVSEVRELRNHGVDSPLFLFARLLPHELKAAVVPDVTLSVSSLEEGVLISEASVEAGRKTPVHVKIDTGMGRLGIPFGRALAVIENLVKFEGLELEGIYTHFPAAETEDGFSERQVRDFSLLVQALEKKGITFRYRHGANSAACLKVKTSVFNMIRPGLMLYGISPAPELDAGDLVRPALSLKSRLISLKRIQPGQSVGYGREFVAEKPTFIGLLPVGYSHGYPVRASRQGSALYQGRSLRLAGRVSMDYLALDFGDSLAPVGAEITVVGEDSGKCIRVEDLAAWAGTIPYEIVTGLNPSIAREYLNSDG